MHHTEEVAPRHSVVVERDWVADEYVVTFALSDPWGNVIWSSIWRARADEWSAVDLESMVHRILAARASSWLEDQADQEVRTA